MLKGGRVTAGQALLCGILYWLAEANVPYVTVWTIQKPLLCGWITGLVLGCPAAGAVCGAMLSLLYIGYRSQGSSMPADIGLAGICAAAVCAAGGSPGFAAAAAIPAGFAGILVWRLRLHVNASFSSRTEKCIREGRKWGILVPAVLQPVLFSAAVCIPVGAVCSFGVYSFMHRLLAGAVSLSFLKTVDFAGRILCPAGLLLSLFPMREKRAVPVFLLGLFIALFTRAPLLLLAVPAFPAAVFLCPVLKKKFRAGQMGAGHPSASNTPSAYSAYSADTFAAFDSTDYFDPDLDEDWSPDPNDFRDPDLYEDWAPDPDDFRDPDLYEDWSPDPDGFRDPDLDEDWSPDPDGFRDPDLDEDWSPDPDDFRDPDLDEDWAPDLSAEAYSAPSSTSSSRNIGQTASVYGNHNAGKNSAEHLPSRLALVVSNLLWILFVQAAYNTKQMMGQAAAAAFLPVLEELCPGRPADQQKILERQCEYLNTQPEMGSALLGCLIRLEARNASVIGEGPDAGRIRSVRSSLMGPIGGLGDELFQCGWIPILLLIASDCVLRGHGAVSVWIPVYGIAAAVSGAVLSGVCFARGFSGDEM